MKIESSRQTWTKRTDKWTNKRRLWLVELLSEPKMFLNKQRAPADMYCADTCGLASQVEINVTHSPTYIIDIIWFLDCVCVLFHFNYENYDKSQFSQKQQQGC